MFWRKRSPSPYKPEDNIDMDDSIDMPSTQPLKDILEHSQKYILPNFKEADGKAIHYQAMHQGRARTVAWLGAWAVILATLQLLAPPFELDPKASAAWFWPALVWGGRWYLPLVESLVVFLLLLLVLEGIRRYLKEEWLIERFKAERLRLLKFQFLLSPELWGANSADFERCKNVLCDHVKDIAASTEGSLESWASEGTVPAAHPAPLQIDDQALNALVDYYRRKRLRFQMDYFSKRIETLAGRDRKTRLAAPVIFFGSVAFVLVHIALEPAGGSASKIFIFLAAALPALGAGFRTIRSANESARNASRFEANYHVLRQISERLRTAVNPDAVFRDLGFCEQVLESDHREWLRLMVEAEWFG